jgi:hypothetical protein
MAEDEVAPSPIEPRMSAPKRRPASLVTTFAVSAVSVALLVAAIDGVAHFTTGSNLWPSHRSPDNVSEGDKLIRQEAFAAMAPLTLAPVSDQDDARALDSMRVAPAVEQQLQTELATPPFLKPAEVTAKAAAASSVNASTRSAAPARPLLRLVWLTVWDTDVEDGDIVRIDSGGYSRTIALAKKPMTFAVPAPADGVIKITGISDGDGGGVTVGLASGPSTAVFPVMSVGQVLGLRARLQ